eukprot:1680424-Amphidinium_carterae.1
MPLPVGVNTCDMTSGKGQTQFEPVSAPQAERSPALLDSRERKRKCIFQEPSFESGAAQGGRRCLVFQLVTKNDVP